MKLRFSAFILCFLVFTLFSCSSRNGKKTNNKPVTETVSLNQFKWLVGNWQNLTDEFDFYENWNEINSELFSGESFMIIDGDTVFSEFISLALSKDEILYTASVSDQNDGFGVRFKLISAEDNKYIFNNPKHDYPQTIVYRYVAPDSLYIYIEGNLKEEYKREDFVMIRAK